MGGIPYCIRLLLERELMQTYYRETWQQWHTLNSIALPTTPGVIVSIYRSICACMTPFLWLAANLQTAILEL